MDNKDIINALPLVAGILGRKYGISVEIGGNTACTDGNTIYLPALPLDSDADLLGFARSFLDHEAAHIRETDFNALKINKLGQIEKHIWNIFEDYRVEHKLAAIFPGCRHNFNWLIKKIFLEEYQFDATQEQLTPAQTSRGSTQEADDSLALDILNWILLTVRSWDVPELQTKVIILANKINIISTNLLSKLEALLSTVPKRCNSTQDCIIICKEVLEIIKQYLKDFDAQVQEEALLKPDLPHSDVQQLSLKNIEALRDLLANKLALPDDFSTSIAKTLSCASQTQEASYKVAVETQKVAKELTPAHIANARQASTALRTRLQALLQSNVATRNRHGYTGRLDPQQLHRLSSGSAKVFKRQGIKQGLDTAVHVLIDSSGSITGSIGFASEACFAVASALLSLPKMKVAVSSFPGETIQNNKGSSPYASVGIILKYGEKLHNKFNISAAGGTPMAEALWWTLQQMQALPEKRKIILLITDGQPDSIVETKLAILATKQVKVELYGIGIGDRTIHTLLPDHSQYIDNIQQLAPAMFELLQGALVKSV